MQIMTDLLNIIHEVENKWLKITYDYIQKLFQNKHLPSHDHLHHQRVWNFACNLLISYSEKYNIRYSYNFLESLFFGCFFHDSGLTQSLQAEHGKLSVLIFNEFIREKQIPVSDYYNELTDAIERHDDKSYQQKSYNKEKGLYQFLTVADDLDAFGALGLMRYLEIYSYRNITYDIIKDKINSNLVSRFSFVSDFLKFDQQIYTVHENRFKASILYLEKLNTEDIKHIIGLITEGKFIHNIDLDQQTENVKKLINQAVKDELNNLIME